MPLLKKIQVKLSTFKQQRREARFKNQVPTYLHYDVGISDVKPSSRRDFSEYQHFRQRLKR